MRTMAARHSGGITASPVVGNPATAAGQRINSAGGVSRTSRTITWGSGGATAGGALVAQAAKLVDSSSPPAAHAIILDCRIGRLHS